MKNIKKIICIALLAIFAVACTNEEEINDGTLSPSINKKSGKGSNRTYSQYEPIDKYTDANIQTMVNGFNDKLNKEGEIMPDYSIADAVIMLETHFNYGVVNKLPYNQDAEEYFEPRNFTFTVPLRDNKVNGESLKPLYFEFVNYILTQMNNKNLELSDIYVQDINSTSVTFGLDMTPSIRLPYYPNNYMFVMRKFKERGSIITIPSSVSSTWSNMPDWSTEINVYNYSFRRLMPDDPHVATVIVSDNGFDLAIEEVPNFLQTLTYNNLQLQDITAESINKAYDALEPNHWDDIGFTVINYNPCVVRYTNSINNITHYYYKIHHTSVYFGKLSRINIGDLYMSEVTDRLTFRD